MGFFKEFRDDLSKAVNELLPESEIQDDQNAQKDKSQDETEAQDEQDPSDEGKPEDDLEPQDEQEPQEQIVNTLDYDVSEPDENSESERMKVILDEFTQEEEKEKPENLITEIEPEAELVELSDEIEFDNAEGEEEEDMDDNVDLELLEAMNADEEESTEESNEESVDSADKTAPKLRAASVASEDTVTVISKGTSINGNVSSDGSLDIMGTVTGDVECLGKLTITGKIIGNSSAAEVYVNTERLEGCITSEGSVKIGLGTVVIGDISATSAVIAGAVKGEIDINGPVVIDSTAIIKGNIKAKSVQINNGAVVEGFCSLCYSDINFENVFE